METDIDPTFDPLLMKQTFRIQGQTSIKIGDNIVTYSKFFKLFLTSKLRNPRFSPELQTKLTLVNFTITKESLEAQLLELCIKKEKPDLEITRQQLIISKHESERQLDQIEQQILQILNRADNILDDEKAINTLNKSKSLAIDIEQE